MDETMNNEQSTVNEKYTMTISRLTVNKLGVKLYDKVSAVLAELISNSYDADATEVEIVAPMNGYLATKQKGKVQDKGFVVEIRDNGTGMTPDEVNEFYLRVGAERRSDDRRGDVSNKFKRKVMGRKGIGKLAPFGICEQIEVLTSGGDLLVGKDEYGNKVEGYLTAHIILHGEEILGDKKFDMDADYHPEVGVLDGIVRPTTGTAIRLTNFEHRQVPSLQELERQMAQRFGITAPNWQITLVDAVMANVDPHMARIVVGHFDVPKMENTEIRFAAEKDAAGNEKVPAVYRAFDAGGHAFPENELRAGFDYDGRVYTITGWVAYAKENYKDELMAGVRIYCRGKIAAQPLIFNMKSGFTGEYDIRSYLVGELHADWLDETEDLIQTDRRDILWSHDLGRAFEAWGQEVVKRIGRASRSPMKKKSADLFKELSDVESRVAQAFSGVGQEAIRENALEIATTIAKTMREEEIRNDEQRNSVVELSLSLAPHMTLNNKLREAASSTDSPLGVITSILKTARVAELASFGRIAEERIGVIEKIIALKDDPKTLEDAFQELIEQAPWLINPQWSPIVANQSFSTLKTEFEKYYKDKTGEEIVLGNFRIPNKRADFVLSTQDNVIQIVEIKRPHHKFGDDEMVRLERYIALMESFLNEATNKEFRVVFHNFHVTLVCDDEKLSGMPKRAFDLLIEKGTLAFINWTTFLLRTKKMHEEFLNEAERQRRYTQAS